MKFILFYTKDQGQDIIRLAHADTRLICGTVSIGGQPSVACYGEDVRSAVVRSFLDDASALAWLKEQAKQGREDVDFLIEKPDDRRIVELGGAAAREVLGKVRRTT